jgi:hypothetical protein
MNKVVDKTPLKNRTAWNHLQTVKRAVEIVNSWPEWKRDTVLFRDKSNSATTSGRTDCLHDIAPRRRSA